MNIDRLPLQAFSLESVPSAIAVAQRGQTLTLPLKLGPVPPMREAMAGSVTTGLCVPCPETLTAAVVAARADAITLTF